jgi:hypothetical protein
MASSLDLAKTYTSFAGVDIKVVMNGQVAGSMQAVSYAIQREKAPIYVMGSVDPISFSRGKRGIAGTMISLMLNHHMLNSEAFKNEKAYLDKGEIFASIDPAQADQAKNVSAAGSSAMLQALGNSNQTGLSLSSTSAGQRTQYEQQNAALSVNDITANYAWNKVFYVDQILPFDVVIHAVNEYGNSAQMRLFGCEILNEGSGFSIDDIVIENQMTYVCRTLLPWTALAVASSGGDFNNSNRNQQGTQAQ